MRPIDPSVVIWLVLAIVGFIFASIGSRDAHLSVRRLLESGERGGSLIVARSVRRDSYGRALVELIFISLGVSVIVAEWFPPNDVAMLVREGVFIRYGLVVSSGILALLTILDWTERRQLLLFIRRSEQQRDSLQQAAARAHRETISELHRVHEEVAENTMLTRQIADHSSPVDPPGETVTVRVDQQVTEDTNSSDVTVEKGGSSR